MVDAVVQLSEGESGSRNLVTVVLICFVIIYTGFNYLQARNAPVDEMEGFVEVTDYSFSFITPEETPTIEIGITDTEASTESGWFIAKLEGNSKQYGVIWVEKDKIPSDYTRDLDGFLAYVIDTVEASGVVFSGEENVACQVTSQHVVEEHLYWIIEDEKETPVMTGLWCCDESDLCILVYSLLDQELGSMDDLEELWRFYTEHVRCC